jgi:NifU-like protein involved in Fe-S cluster formation
MYSDQLMKRFLNPAYSGDIERPDGVGVEGNITCGDVVSLAVRLEDGLIAEARFRTQGCATAIAASDLACELVTGTPITYAQTIQAAELAAGLGGIPEQRLSCAGIALGALQTALEEALAGRVAKDQTEGSRAVR